MPDYSPLVAELFRHLDHVGTLKGPEVLAAHAGAAQQGAALRLQVQLKAGQIELARFRAYGCPHFLAACEYLCRWLEGRPLNALADWSGRDLEQVLQIPPPKRGRLLLLESLVHALAAR